MAKHNCAICGAEVGLLTEQKLADGNFICRKVCCKKSMQRSIPSIPISNR